MQSCNHHRISISSLLNESFISKKMLLSGKARIEKIIKDRNPFLRFRTASGAFNVKEYLKHKDDFLTELRHQMAEIESTSNARLPRYSRCNKRRYRRGLGLVRENGRVLKSEIFHSGWYQNYVRSPKIDDDVAMKLFRRRFRMPYDAWQKLLAECRTSPIFNRWNNTTDAIGISCTPLELLVLGALRYLGRGWTFDDISEATGIGKETHRVFFHEIATYGSTELYDKYVTIPASFEEATACSNEFEKVGMPDAIGSTDAVNIVMDKCTWRMRQAHIGFKQALTARTYNVTVNHRRQILYCTKNISPALTMETANVRIVPNLPHDYFRRKLVEHFNIKFHQNEVIWPRRNRVPRPIRISLLVLLVYIIMMFTFKISQLQASS